MAQLMTERLAELVNARWNLQARFVFMATPLAHRMSFLQYEILGFLIILLALAYFLNRRYTHHDRRIKKDRRAKELQQDN